MTDTTSVADLRVAGLLRRGDQALVVQRSLGGQQYAGCWDLPIGPARPGEPSGSAVVRVLQKQIGVRVEPPEEPFAHLQGHQFRVDVYLVDRWIGRPSNRAAHELDGLAWFTPEEVTGLRLADPRLPGLLQAGIDQPR